MPSIVTIDFETEAIEDRPNYPPRPVGVAINDTYLAWNHPTENNCTYEDAKEALTAIWESEVEMLFHNGKFDLDVAEEWLDLDIPPWERVHDSMFLVYLYNPHARSVALKPSCEVILNWPPEERDELHEWIMANTACTKSKEAGAWISHTPGDMCGRYAVGDTRRTRALFDKLIVHVEANNMLEAYNRERRLMPILLESERHGILLDTKSLAKDLPTMEAALDKVTGALCRMLKIKPHEAYYKPNKHVLDASQRLGDLLERSGHADPSKWLPTKKGSRSVGKDSLRASVDNKRLLALLGYRAALNNALSTFMRPWHALTVGQNYDRLHTNWNQVRNPEGYGTRTGRISSNRPNFANVPNEYDDPPKGHPPIPLMRSYLLPDKGHVWLKRDYSAQEIRILAHYEDDSLAKAFNETPNLDPHQFAAELIMAVTAIELNRNATKIIAFSICYGKGVRMLAVDLNVEYHQGYALKKGYFDAFPGIEGLAQEVKQIGSEGEAVRTVGGRVMYSEPEAEDGRRFDYKLLNHLIQGSASDLTKQAIIDYFSSGGVGHMLAQVYDEINLSVPKGHAEAMDVQLQEAIAGKGIVLDVPLTSDAYVGSSWSSADNNKQRS